MPDVIVNLSGSPVASGSTPEYTALLVDATGVPIAGSTLTSLTLSIVNTLTGAVVNDVSQIDILNTGRGHIDEDGNLTINLEEGDTSMDDVPGAPQVQRSLVIDWTYNSGLRRGRHQANFTVVALAGP